MKPLPAGYKIEPADHLTDTQERSFLNRNDITKVLLEPGDVLWRIVSKINGKRFSDFWMDRETMRSLMSVFTSWGNYSEGAKKGVIRDNIAILDAWHSNLSWRCQVTLQQNVVGYTGQTGPQKIFSENKEATEKMGRKVESIGEFKIGGFNQIVIPRFKGVSDEDAQRWGVVSHFARL